MKTLRSILQQQDFSKDDIVFLLSLKEKSQVDELLNFAYKVKTEQVGRIVYYRGLIELSNKCKKDCFYCGIRASNKIERFSLTEKEVLECADFAYKNNYGSLVIQSGERNDKAFVDYIDTLLQNIHEKTNNELRITLSCGEQSLETYLRWRRSGASRYLLRIEASNKELYAKIHPQDDNHNYEKRLEAIQDLRLAGYQVGTGVMIGLPFQTLEHLADDLIFIKNQNIDMVGMGPYIEHPDTPLYQYKESLFSLEERFELSLKMIAILRIMMKDINIASTTALQTINSFGREAGLLAGANVIMPNLTPVSEKKNYLLYANKPSVADSPESCAESLTEKIEQIGEKIAFGKWGDSLHYRKRK